MKVFASLVLATVASAASLPALAQFQKPEDAIEYRQAVFTVMGAHFGRIGAMVNNRVPFDATAAADNAAVVETMSKLPWAAFGPGTDRGDTRAQPAIWTEQAKFREGAQRMQTEVARLSVAAKTGNLDAIRSAFGVAGQTCKACHDAYRKD